jgi:hypothetical protein
MLTVAGILGGWMLLLLRPRRVSTDLDGAVTFLGYTNDPAGKRLVMFTVTNWGDVAVARAPHCVLAIKPPGQNWTPQSAIPLSNPVRAATLGSKGSEVITVPKPITQSPWRITIFFSNDVGPNWPLKRLANTTCRFFGWTEPYGYTTRAIDSRSIERENDN